MRRAILTQIFAPGDVRPGNVLEAAVFWPLALLYPIWFVGGLYLVGSVLGWLLGIILVLRILRSGINPIPLTLWVWIAGVLTIALTLFVAHNGYGRGTGTLIKSMVSWGRTWALLPLYLLAGCLPIRPQIVYRGAAIVCAWTLALLPAFMALKAIHFREVWFTSPLKVIGGPNALSFFQIGVYSSEDHGAGELRWKLFAPWSPALGLIGVCFFMLALQEKGGWRWIGLAGSVAMVLLSGSRLSLVCLPFVLVVSWCLQNLKRPMFLAGVGVASLLGGGRGGCNSVFFVAVLSRFQGTSGGEFAGARGFAENRSVSLARGPHLGTRTGGRGGQLRSLICPLVPTTLGLGCYSYTGWWDCLPS